MRLPDRAPISQGREADAREGDGKDEHQRRSHDAEEDGHGCEDGGQGFSMTLHGPTMALGRATLAGTEYGGATWRPAQAMAFAPTMPGCVPEHA